MATTILALAWYSMLFPIALDEGDIKLLKTYVCCGTSDNETATLYTLIQGQGPYAKELKTLEQDIKDIQKRVNEKIGKSR